MATYRDEFSQSLFILFVEFLFDLNHINLTARDDDTDKGIIVCSKTLEG